MLESEIMKKVLTVIFMSFLWSSLFLSTLITISYSAENLKKKYVIKNCKGGQNPSSEKAKYTLDISKGLYSTGDNELKTKFFYKISNINNGVVTIGDLQYDLSKGPNDIVNLMHLLDSNMNKETHTININTGEVIEEWSIKESAAPDIKKAIEGAIKADNLSLKEKLKCEIK